MKDGTPDAHSSELPPCSLSINCVRLFDELDEDEGTLQDDPLEDNVQDNLLLSQLRAHVPGCPTCMATLARERAIRSQQRHMFLQLLMEGEQKIPSTTTRILQAIEREQKQSQVDPAASNGHVAPTEIEALSTQPLVQSRPRPVRRSRVLLRNALALVAVLAIVVASANLFSHMLPLHSSSSSTSSMGTFKHTSNPVLHSPDWSAVVMTEISDGQKIITDIDPINGKSAVLASSQYPDGTSVDGVSHDGYKVLYHVFDGTNTNYYIQPSDEAMALYTLNGKGSLAIWSTDDHYVFINTPEGVEKVDTSSRAATFVLPSLKPAELLYYRAGFLYFVENNTSLMALKRIDLTTSNVVSITAGLCALGYGFWLSPGGATVYYRCKDSPDLYAVNSDGTNVRSLRLNVGDAIGYAAQGELLTLLKTGSVYQVIQLGVDVQHDQVVIADVAPGASQLGADNVAVMPYGGALVALAQYSDGSSKIWYNDLVKHQQYIVPTNPVIAHTSNVQFGGWSRLQVS